MSRLLIVLAAAGALVALSACGGNDGESADGEAGATVAAGGEPISLRSCDESGDCSELPPGCEEDPACLAQNCLESGGCVPTSGHRPFAWGKPGDFRLCFDLEVRRSSDEPVGESTPVVTGSSESETTVGPISSIECEGSSYPLDGLDLSEIEDQFEVAEDGQLVWFQEDSSLRVAFTDGAFTVSEQP